VMSDYLIDELTWRADHDVTLDLPLHADIVLGSGVDQPRLATLSGASGTEDGFRFAHDSTMQRAAAESVVQGSAVTASGKTLRLFGRSDHDAEWWRAVAPGAPGAGEHAFRLVRARGANGRHQFVFAWSDQIESVDIGEEIRVNLVDGSSHVHRRAADAWHIELHAGNARSGIDLIRAVAPSETAEPARAMPVQMSMTVSTSAARPTVVHLGEGCYRRSEQAWRIAGEPSADVALSWSDHILRIEIDVHCSDLTFAASGALNRYDNEYPDINGDGVQLYVSSDRGLSAWTLVPEIDSARVRVRQLEGWMAPAFVSASWSRNNAGYRMSVEISGCIPTALDVLINEMPAGRERRRGQLVLSGAAGQFVYLRGDRHPVEHLVQLRFADG
jgi:hypothetical protein